jgi:general stress protein 26
MTDAEAREAIRATIHEQKIGALATVDAAGQPHAAAMGAAITPSLDLIFDTLTATRKVADLHTSPACAWAFWNGPIGIQYEGVAEPLPADSPLIEDVYWAAFPDGRSRQSWPGLTYYRVRPRWIRYCDFSQKPNRIHELSFPVQP